MHRLPEQQAEVDCQVGKDFVGNKLHHSGNNQTQTFAMKRDRVSLALALRAAVVCSAMLWGGSALAWGFGEMRVQSALGEPFRTQINLIGSDVANAERGCFKARLLAFDGAPLGTATVTFRENSHTLLISTRTPVNEPAAALTVNYTCAPQMQREYAILLDLPTSQPSVPVASRQNDTLPMPSSSVAATSNAPAETAPVKKPRRVSPAVDPSVAEEQRSSRAASAAAKPKRPEPKKGSSTETGKAAEQSKSVLKLGHAEPLEDSTGNVFRQRLALSYDLAVPPGESDASADTLTAPDAAAGDQALRQLLDKIHALERKTEALQKLNAEQLNALDEAKKAQTPASSMYILYALLLACVLAIGWLVWRMRQVRSEVKYSSWQQIVPDADTSVDRTSDTVIASAMPTGQAPVSDGASGADVEPTSQAGGSALAKLGRKIARKPELAESLPAASKVPAVAAVRNQNADIDDPFAGMSVATAEEILDEIQEAEFWVHMNQPQRAIAILETEAQPASPLKWLHLFDLYRMVDDREKYEALAARFKLAFNGRVAPWERSEDDIGARSIEDFTHVMDQIIAVWSSDDLVGFLESLLLDNREGNRQGFDLPAYQDLLFLTNIAYQVQAMRESERNELKPLDWPFPDA